jgi:hypothetical protein
MYITIDPDIMLSRVLYESLVLRGHRLFVLIALCHDHFHSTLVMSMYPHEILELHSAQEVSSLNLP